MKIQYIFYNIIIFPYKCNSYAKSGKFDFHTLLSFKPDVV